MLTLLEYQEALRNMSDPDLDQVLSSDPRNKWMAVDEVKRRKVDRKAEKAKLAESRMHPGNMLEEYQAELQSGMVGGHDLYGASSQDPSLRGSIDPYSEMEDPFSQGGEGIPDSYQMGDLPTQEYAWGGTVLGATALGQMLWPLRHQIGRAILPKKAYQKLFRTVPEERMLPASAGSSSTELLAPEAAAAARAEGLAAQAAQTSAGRRDLAKKMGRATLWAAPTAGMAVAMSGDDDDQLDTDGMLGSEAPEPPTGALSTFEKMYLDQMQQTREGQLAIQKQLEEAKLSGRQKIGRILLRAGGAAAMAGDQWVGGLLTGASEAIAEITEEERARINELIANYRAGELSQAQLMGAFADLQSTRARSGKPPITQSQFMTLEQQGWESEDITDSIRRYQSLVGGRQGPAHDGVAVDYRNDYNDQGIRRR